MLYHFFNSFNETCFTHSIANILVKAINNSFIKFNNIQSFQFSYWKSFSRWKRKLLLSCFLLLFFNNWLIQSYKFYFLGKHQLTVFIKTNILKIRLNSNIHFSFITFTRVAIVPVCGRHEICSERERKIDGHFNLHRKEEAEGKMALQ